MTTPSPGGRQGRPRGEHRTAAAASAPTLPPLSPARRRARRKAAWRRRRTVLLFMSPWIVGFSVFFGYPLIDNAYLSFTHYDLLSSPRWIGLANYRYLFSGDQEVWPAVSNTLWFLAIAVPLQVLFAFGVAHDGHAREGAASGSSGRSSTCPRWRRRWRRRSGFVFLFNPGTGPVNTLLSQDRDHRAAVVPVAALGQAVADAAQPVGDRQRDGDLPRRDPRRPQAPPRGGAARRRRSAAAAVVRDAAHASAR